MDRTTYDRAHELVRKIERLSTALLSETAAQANSEFDKVYTLEFNIRQSKERSEWLKRQIEVLQAELKGL